MKTWEIEINGKKHTVTHAGSLKNKVTVDGNTTIVKSNNLLLNIVDYEFNIEGTVCNLTVIGRKAKLAVNGTYLNTNEPYKPLEKIPTWVTVLGSVSIIGGMFLSGLISCIIGVFMTIAYVNLALKRKYGAIIGSFVTCTAVQVALMFFFIYMNLKNSNLL